MKIYFSRKAGHSSRSIIQDMCHEEIFLQKLDIYPGVLYKTCHEDIFLKKSDVRLKVLYKTYVMKIYFSRSWTFVQE
ncbi:hypothetical protein ACOSQ3_022615 [Xanthoceras sorbifolium]